MKRLLVLSALATGLISHAYGQTYLGQLPNNTVLGNTSGGMSPLAVPGQVVNAQLANTAANSLKANTAASPASPVDFGTSTGTPQNVFASYAVNTPGLDIASGSSGTPITTQGPTIRFSRVESIAPSASVCNNNSVDNECNATVAIYSTGTASDGMQNAALFAGATTSQTSNAINAGTAGLFIGRVIGSGVGSGNGVYIEGRRDTATGTSVGAEIRGSNFTATPGTYNSGGFSNTQAIWVTSNGNSIVGTGIGIGAAGQSFTVGVGVTAGAVTGQAFRDDSSANVSFLSRPASGASQITLDPATAAQQAVINFQQTDVGKWQLGKDTANDFFIFDNVGGQDALLIAPAGNITLSPKGGTTVVTGTLDVTTSYQINGTPGISKTCTGASSNLVFTNGILTGGTTC